MMTLKEIETILISNKFRNITDSKTRKRTNDKKLFFQRGIYSIHLDDTGGGVIVDLFKHGQIDHLHNPSINTFYGLFSYIELSTYQKKSIHNHLLHLDDYYNELIINKYQDYLLAGEKKFIANYQRFNK